MSKSNKYDSELDKINRKDYDYYEKIQDYEYSYVIANEMLHRTKSFKELFEIKIEDRKEKWIKKATKLGLDTYDPKLNFTFKNELILLNQDSYSYTINDLGGGNDALYNLIDYYYRKNKIYEINFKKNILCTNFLEEITIDEVYKNSENYYIPCKDLISLNEDINIKPISRKLLLRELEDSFLDTLTLKDIIDFNGVIEKYWNNVPFICDIDENALSNLIAFYNEDNRIYKEIKKTTYERINNSNNIYILLNHENFFIPCRVNKNNKSIIEYKKLSDKILLSELDKKFVANIKLSRIEFLENKVSSSLLISDIDGGFNKLINYYIEKGKIYSQKLSKKTKKKFKHCNINKYYKNVISPWEKIMNKYNKFIDEPKTEMYFKKKSINNYKKIISKYKYNRKSLIKKIMNKYDMYYIPVNDSLKEKKTKLIKINKN